MASMVCCAPKPDLHQMLPPTSTSHLPTPSWIAMRIGPLALELLCESCIFLLHFPQQAFHVPRGLDVVLSWPPYTYLPDIAGSSP
jgi:hypothetical protein